MRVPRLFIRALSRIFPAGSGPGWALLLAGIAVLAVWQGRVRQAEQAEHAARLHADATQIALQLQGRLGEYELTLRGLRGFFEGSTRVEQEEFERYCQTTDPLRRLPGLLAINTLRRVSALEAAGLPIWSEETGPGNRPPARPFYFPVTYRYPPSPKMIGFDGGNTPFFAATIQAAEKRDGLAVSEPAVFPHASIGRRVMFVMALPYYPGGAAHSGPPEGFVELVVRAHRLLDGIFAPGDLEALHLVLRDSAVSPQEEPLLEAGRAAATDDAWHKTIPFGGRTWILAINESFPHAGAAARPALYFAALAVLLMASLVAGLGIGRNRARAAAASLLASEQRARGLMDANLISIFFTGAGGRLLEANDAFLHLLGFSREDLEAGRIDLETLTPPEHQERTRLAVAELLQTGVAKPFEKDYFRKDGTRVPVLAGAARLAAEREEFATFVLDLTARKQTELALRANEERLRLATNAAQIGIWDWTVATDETRWSTQAELLFGVRPGELTGGYAAFISRLHPDDRSVMERWVRGAMAGEPARQLEFRVLRPDGETRWLAGQGERVRDEAGQPLRLIGTIMDINERKDMENSLRQSDERFRTLFDSSPDPVWIIDEHRFVDCNQAAIDMLGYPDKESLRNTHPSELSPEFQPNGEPSYSKAERMMFIAQEKGLNRFEWVHRRWDKSDFFAEVTLSTITVQGRQVIYCLWRDITERKLAELSLAESEKKYRDIFDFAPVGIYRAAPDGRILAANRILAAVLGYDNAESLIGRDMADEIYQDAQERDRLIANYEPGGSAARLEVEFRRRTGAPLWVQLDAHAVKDAQGRTLYFEGFVHDIDTRKRAEAGLESARAEHEKRSALLLKIARSPALAGDLPAILNAVTEAATAGLHCARSSVWFFSASGTAECAGRYLAAESRHAPGGTLRADDYPEYFRALTGGALLAIGDIVHDPRTANFAAAYLAPLGITASLVAPLRVGGELAGMLTCDHTGGPRAWTLEEQGFLSALGDLMVLARETGERRRAEAQLRALNEALEERVITRTAALAKSNAELAVEVDERRRTHEELRASSALLTAVTEGTTDAIYVKDRDGRYLFINGAGAAFMGLDAKNIIGRTNVELYSPEATVVQNRNDRNVLDLGRTQTFDDVLEVGGRRRIMLSTKGVIRDAAGEITGLFGISRDITTRREQEADLERLNRSLQARGQELEALNEELETFSYSVSHDLRAPLRAIDGFSQALVEDFGGPLGVDGKNLLDRVRAGARQMGQLIDGLLQLSRASRGALHREPLDLSALAQAVVHDLQAGDPGRRQTVDIEPGLHAEGDPALLRAVLQNLLGNAWKFTAGVPGAEIHFARAAARRHPGFVVRDTGVGFDPAYAGKLFQPFQRLHRASDFPGTGIGLATVQRIIRRHNGRVWAESQPGKGASFYFTLWDATSDLFEEKIEK